ncbi:MAG: phosphatase PAP2 family protein [Patescibacteria group bacterium]|nr:phosphatase PAP2 family protein [Patescibacteria group bacterium]
MQNLLERLRLYDFNSYYYLYQISKKSLFFDVFFYFFAKYGIVFFFLSFIYLIWNKKIKAFFCGFIAMGIASFIDFTISLLWQRPRPYIAHPDLAMPYTAGLRVDDISFPSSHTYIAFAVATSVFLYGHKKLGLTLFMLAVIVAASRVGTGLHYPSDVIGGAILGILSGVIAHTIVQRLEKGWE